MSFRRRFREIVNRALPRIKSEDYFHGCPYWTDDHCTGYNCCTEDKCPYARKYQPWLFDGTVERRPVTGAAEDCSDAIRAEIAPLYAGLPQTVVDKLEREAEQCRRAGTTSDGHCVGYCIAFDEGEPVEMCKGCIFLDRHESEV